MVLKEDEGDVAARAKVGTWRWWWPRMAVEGQRWQENPRVRVLEGRGEKETNSVWIFFSLLWFSKKEDEQ